MEYFYLLLLPQQIQFLHCNAEMYENRCLYTYIYVWAELNGGLKRYRLWSICDPDHKNTNEI